MNENDEILYECGVDLNSTLTFNDGDICLCKYGDNLIQAIVNRLNTSLNEMDLFYEDYGSILQGFLGWKANDETIEYIKAEIDNSLMGEPRLAAHESNVEYTGNGKVRIELSLYTNTGAGVDASLVLSSTGVMELSDDEVTED